MTKQKLLEALAPFAELALNIPLGAMDTVVVSVEITTPFNVSLGYLTAEAFRDARSKFEKGTRAEIERAVTVLTDAGFKLTRPDSETR